MTDSTTTQPNGGNGEQPQELVIDGVKYTADDIKKGVLLQADYTKKTQQLAEERKKLDDEKKKLNIQDDSPITAETARKIAQEATAAQAEKYEAARSRDEFFALNPHLAAQRAAIEAVAEARGIAVEDAAEKYKFAEASKVQRRGGASGGTGNAPEKDVSDMTLEEYQAHKKTQGIGYQSGLTRGAR